MDNKDKDYIEFSDKIAAKSKDQSTKVGSIFTDPEKLKQPCFGYNGMPRGLDDNHPERNIKPEKYFWYEHAERNNIYNKARETLSGSIIFSSVYIDMEAARAITSSGIKTCVVPVSQDWEDNLSSDAKKMRERVITLFEETGVKLIEINREDINKGFDPYASENSIKEFNMKEKYLSYLDLAAEWGNIESRDYENKSGAIILDSLTFNPLGMGAYNPPDRLINITDEMRTPENKSKYFLDAVKKAVFSTVKPYFTGMSLHVNKCPCNDCALAVVDVGTKKVVTRKIDLNNEMDKRWLPSFEASQNIFQLTGVEFETIYVPEPVMTEKKKIKMKR